MSATKSEPRTWPTMREADDFVRCLRSAYNAVDEMALRCHGLIDREEPWEKPACTPSPRPEDMAALVRLVTHLRSHVKGDDRATMRATWLREFEQLLASAVEFEADARAKAVAS